MVTKLCVGKTEVWVTEEDVRAAQSDLLAKFLSPGNRALIDAILSHFANGRETTWIKEQA